MPKPKQQRTTSPPSTEADAVIPPSQSATDEQTTLSCTPDTSAMDTCQEILPVSSQPKKQKRMHLWKPRYLIDYKWLRKDGDLLFCKCCLKFPQFTNKRVEFLKGWAGTSDGYKEEQLQRHQQYHDDDKHKKCAMAWEALGLSFSNSVAPEVETWSSKISKSSDAELKTKFVASNLPYSA